MSQRIFSHELDVKDLCVRILTGNGAEVVDVRVPVEAAWAGGRGGGRSGRGSKSGGRGRLATQNATQPPPEPAGRGGLCRGDLEVDKEID